MCPNGIPDECVFSWCGTYVTEELSDISFFSLEKSETLEIQRSFQGELCGAFWTRFVEF